MTNKEKVDILLKYFRNENGNINLSKIDFGDKKIYLSELKAKEIHNNSQEAEYIYNENQKVKFNIYNDKQKSKYIHNNSQEAKKTYH